MTASRFTAALLVTLMLSLGCMRAERPRIQGSGVAKSEQRQVENFEKITIAGSAQVKVRIGDETQVMVETDDNILPIVETRVSGDTLTISTTEPHRTKIGIKVTITTPSLSAVSIKGAGDIDVTGVKGESFSAAIAGSGDLQASGSVNKLDCAIRGSGDLKLGDLQANSVSVTIAGSGDVTVNAVDELSVNIAGSGDVKYRGNPQKLNKSIAGSGSVRQAG